MPSPCSICIHPEREAIEKALLEPGTSYRVVAKRFDLSEPALYRHRKRHLPELIARGLSSKPKDPASDGHAEKIAAHTQEAEAKTTRQALDVVHQLRAVNAACLEVLRQARTDGQPLILLRAVDRITRQIEIQAKLLSQIQEGPTVSIAVLPEWHGIRLVVLEALMPFPEARLAVANALKGAQA